MSRVVLDIAARERLRAALVATGFDEVRFAAAAPLATGGLRRWLAEGFHADMAWMERSAAAREDPAEVLPGVGTVIALGVNYLPPAGAERGAGGARWARYALYADYHVTLRRGLEQARAEVVAAASLGPDDTRVYVDTGPVMERGWAARAGMGFAGKNTMLISRQHGNWLFLAVVLARMDVPPDPPLGRSTVTEDGRARTGGLCGKCTRCMDACPTGALPAPGVLDARRCISYHTIENRGSIPEALRPAFGDRVFGCDACLEVCPWNRFAAEGRSRLLAARREGAALGLAELLALDEARFRELFRGTPVTRTKLTGLLRNACVAAGNSRRADLLPAVERLCGHGSEVVREHAAWARDRLRGEQPSGPSAGESTTRATLESRASEVRTGGTAG